MLNLKKIFIKDNYEISKSSVTHFFNCFTFLSA